jgi:hypothetical protein
MTAVSKAPVAPQYLLQTTTLAVYWSGGKGQHLHIPAGSLLAKAQDSEIGSPFIEVLWNDRRLQMFAEDFDHRTQPVNTSFLQV